MKKEWITSYNQDLEKLKNIILENSHQTKNNLPNYTLKQNFFDNYLSTLDSKLSETNSNPYLRFSIYQEHRILNLINNLQKAKIKYENNNSVKQEEKSKDIAEKLNSDKKVYTSQMLAIHEIIKNSFELTTTISIIDWLNGVSPKQHPERSVIKERPNFNKTTEKNLGKKNEYFHPDLLHSQNNDIDSEDMERFHKIMEEIVILVRQGKLYQAQQTAEYYEQYFISAMLHGGLPMNDFLLDKAEVFDTIDFDLFPPFMKNKDWHDIQKNLKNLKGQYRKSDNISKIFDKVVGNSNWLLWFFSFYQGCESNLNHSISDKYANQLKLLQTYISGNPIFLDKINPSVYDTLFTYLTSMLNLQIINEYSLHSNIQNFHFVVSEQPDFSQIIIKHVNGRSVLDLINIIKSNEKYREVLKFDFIIDLEFELIELHFLEHYGDKIFFYEKLNEFLIKIIHTFESPEFNSYLSSHYNLVGKTLQVGAGDMTHSIVTELEQKKALTMKLIKLNYFKILFMTVISFYSSHTKKFEIDRVQSEKSYLIDKFDEIKQNFDVIITLFFVEQVGFITNVQNLVYIQCFSLNINTVQANLTYLANHLSENESSSYESLVKEIEKHLSENREILITGIANNSKIYLIPSNLSSIDDILERDIKENTSISIDDRNKINEISLLFIDRKLEHVTILKFMLKLTFKFISNNKFNEASLLLRQFNDKLDINKILGDKFIKDYKLEDDENFVILLERNSFGENKNNLRKLLYQHNLESFKLAIYFAILFVKISLDCYLNYLDLVRKVISGKAYNNISQHPKFYEKIKEVEMTFRNFIRVVRILIINENIKQDITNFFEGDVFQIDIKTIISKWVYQIIKWIVDLYTLDIFKKFNLNGDNG